MGGLASMGNFECGGAHWRKAEISIRPRVPSEVLQNSLKPAHGCFAANEGKLVGGD